MEASMRRITVPVETAAPRSMRRGAAPPVVALAVLAVLGVGCGDDSGDESPESPAVPNPASEYCEQTGGTLEIVTEAGGEVGYCLLPDGRRIEEWELYRSATTVAQP
jgi:uncharacterized protein